MTTVNYETDIIAWANEQARLIRSRNFELLDIEHIAEEIEDVGKSEQRELASRMAALLCHLLKWQYQPARQSSSWKPTIKRQRERIRHRLNKTPSLKNCLNDDEWWADAWADARDAAEKETGIFYNKFPKKCDWQVENILLDEWFPQIS